MALERRGRTPIYALWALTKGLDLVEGRDATILKPDRAKGSGWIIRKKRSRPDNGRGLDRRSNHAATTAISPGGDRQTRTAALRSHNFLGRGIAS
jgi:hypothetical protein